MGGRATVTRPIDGTGPVGTGGTTGTPLTSADGSIEIDIGDLSVAGYGDVTLIRSAAELDSLAVGGLITLAGLTTLTGAFQIAAGNHVLVTGALAGTHIDNTGIIGDFDGPLVEGVVLQNFFIQNTSVGASTADLLVEDLSGRSGRVHNISTLGLCSGSINNVAGASEFVDILQNGQDDGFTASNLLTAFRLIGCASINSSVGLTAYTWDASAVISVGVVLEIGAFLTEDAGDTAAAFDDAMSLGPSALIQVVGNVVTGPGRLIDESPGNIDGNDVRMVAKGNTTFPEYSVLGQAVFHDTVTPIVHTPSEADLTVFDVLTVENVGPTNTLTMSPIARRSDLVINGAQDWYFEVLGPIGDLLTLVRFSVTVVKSGTRARSIFKYQIQFAGAGPWVDLDETQALIDVSTTEQTHNQSAHETTDPADRLRVVVSSESTDSISISNELLSFTA